MGGLLGRLFHEFAITAATAILISGLVSLSLTPMLCSRFLRSHSHDQQNKLLQKTDRLFQKALATYKRTLQWALANSRYVFLAFGISLLATIVLFYIIPKGFLPNQDIDQIFAFSEADPSIPIAKMIPLQQAAVTIIRHDPNVLSVMSSVGAGGASSTQNNGRLFIGLKPRAERSLSADAVIQELRPKLAHIPGIKIYLQNIAAITIGGHASKSTYQYTLQDMNLAELTAWTTRFQDKLAQLPQLQDVTNDLQMQTPQIIVNINRTEAATLGVSAQAIQQTLGYAFGSQQISNIYTDADTYQVILELEPHYQLNARALSQLYVRSSAGTLIPLSTIAHFSLGSTPISINHQNLLPAATISFNLKPTEPLSDAVQAIAKVKNELNPPATLVAGFSGAAQSFQSSQTGMSILLIAAILVIYLILGILYESFIHPLTILSGLPPLPLARY
jgi:HAE1 family hydrophobic/amphiphilic exporter-1